jgi:hypothetical protein
MDEPATHYQRLRTELDAAYAEERWDSERIDRIARELICVECQLARNQGMAAREKVAANAS